jgi:hypothetical protein
MGEGLPLKKLLSTNYAKKHEQIQMPAVVDTFTQWVML